MDELNSMMSDFICVYRKQGGKGVKQGTLEVDAKYFTTELMEEKMG